MKQQSLTHKLLTFFRFIVFIELEYVALLAVVEGLALGWDEILRALANKLTIVENTL